MPVTVGSKGAVLLDRRPETGRGPNRQLGPGSKADISGGERGRRKWADSAPTRVASGRSGVRAKAVTPLRGITGAVLRQTTHQRQRLCDLRHLRTPDFTYGAPQFRHT